MLRAEHGFDFVQGAVVEKEFLGEGLFAHSAFEHSNALFAGLARGPVFAEPAGFLDGFEHLQIPLDLSVEHALVANDQAVGVALQEALHGGDFGGFVGEQR